jgi:hypothetical protein
MLSILYTRLYRANPLNTSINVVARTILTTDTPSPSPPAPSPASQKTAAPPSAATYRASPTTLTDTPAIENR